jgi:DNA-binding response OmpR family regulator
LLLTESVALVFEPVDGVPLMMTDEGKVSQILRNFISNALKFTERGEIRVRASVTDDGQAVAFSVSDTGIGIAPEDQARIFEEFTQIDNPLQRKVKGTGLGLPLCRKLASLLGGSVHVTSQLEAGSTFVAVIPIHYAAPEPTGADSVRTPLVEVKAGSVPVLVVEDEPETCLLYEKYLRRTAFQPIAAGGLFQARELLRRYHFAAIILDIVLPGDSAWSWLAELKGHDDTKNIPILIVSSVDDRPKGLALGADDYALKPVRREWLLNRLEQLIGQAAAHVVKKNPIVLIIDDQEADRYILRRYFSELGYACVEAVDGEEGLQLAVQRKPTVILLDFNLPGVNGAEILTRLSQDPMTAMIPVIVVTAELLSPEVRAKLLGAKLILPKQGLTSAICERALRDINL